MGSGFKPQSCWLIPELKRRESDCRTEGATEVRRGYQCKHTESSLHADVLLILRPELYSKKPYKIYPPSCPTVKGGTVYPYSPACIQAHFQVAYIGVPNKKPLSWKCWEVLSGWNGPIEACSECVTAAVLEWEVKPKGFAAARLKCSIHSVFTFSRETTSRTSCFKVAPLYLEKSKEHITFVLTRNPSTENLDGLFNCDSAIQLHGVLHVLFITYNLLCQLKSILVHDCFSKVAFSLPTLIVRLSPW